MDDRGCFFRIVDGFAKGCVIGGIVGCITGIIVHAPPTEILRLSVKSGAVFGTVKMVIGALIC